jgi:hypothetical protein
VELYGLLKSRSDIDKCQDRRKQMPQKIKQKTLKPKTHPFTINLIETLKNPFSFSYQSTTKKAGP